MIVSNEVENDTILNINIVNITSGVSQMRWLCALLNLPNFSWDYHTRKCTTNYIVQLCNDRMILNNCDSRSG